MKKAPSRKRKDMDVWAKTARAKTAQANRAQANSAQCDPVGFLPDGVAWMRGLAEPAAVSQFAIPVDATSRSETATGSPG
jgi:hypothetical protein